MVDRDDEMRVELQYEIIDESDSLIGCDGLLNSMRGEINATNPHHITANEKWCECHIFEA